MTTQEYVIKSAALLEEKYRAFNQPFFIEKDPISVPHRFSKLQDIEIAGLFAAVLAWGNRTMIIRNSNRIMELMDNSPHDFLLHHQETDLKKMLHFVHRTFNATDLLYFIHFLQYHYQRHNSLETAFSQFITPEAVDIKEALIGFHEYFFSLEDAPHRTRKHISTPARKSACKRLNMYLRWMVRKDDKGVDFGLWKSIQPSQLIIPMDTHVSDVAHRLRILERKQSDWKAADELTQTLKILDPMDPVKYDFALFGLGVLEKF